jgi:hypothetical protein
MNQNSQTECKLKDTPVQNSISVFSEQMLEYVRDAAYDSVEWSVWKDIYFKSAHNVARPLFLIRDNLDALINERLNLL